MWCSHARGRWRCRLRLATLAGFEAPCNSQVGCVAQPRTRSVGYAGYGLLFAGGQVFGTREMCGEFGFNQPPAQGIIRIVGRQRPNGVNMVRQYAYGDGFKGILFLHIHISRMQ